MTAMMAFFLVLWIINATDKDTKTIIARYFNPVKLEETSRTPKSIHGDGTTTPAVDAPDRGSGAEAEAAWPEIERRQDAGQPAADRRRPAATTSPTAIRRARRPTSAIRRVPRRT